MNKRVEGQIVLAGGLERMTDWGEAQHQSQP